MRSATRYGAGILLFAALPATCWLRYGHADTPSEIRGITVSGATQEQVELVRWAVGRFELWGLAAPAAAIRFHTDGTACGGHLGFARGGVVDICTTLVNAMSRRTLLHELGHLWLDENADETARRRFLELRDLRHWNDSSDPWRQRGYEQGAEIIAYAIGDRILTAQVPHNEPAALLEAFEVLTEPQLADPGSPNWVGSVS
jgi:hypothetical protein